MKLEQLLSSLRTHQDWKNTNRAAQIRTPGRESCLIILCHADHTRKIGSWKGDWIDPFPQVE